MKTCNRCHVERSDADFYARGDRPGLRSYCKPCGRAMDREAYRRNPAIKVRSSRRQELKRFGLTEESYEAILRAQGGVCAICGKAPSRQRLCVDHDHETDRVRGLLCSPCNRAIGHLGDCEAGVARALAYLQKG